MQERTIVCPILKKQIDDTICYDIHMNVEGLLPDWGVPKEVVCIPDYKRICMECKNPVVFLYPFLRKRGRATWKMKNF